MRNSKTLRFFDFTGGLNSTAPVTSLSYSQAVDLKNVNILPSGGFEKRNGNTVFNSSAMNGGANVQGIGYYRQADQDEFLMAIAGAKLYKSDTLDGTMDDITGALSISAGQNNIWTHSQMNDLSIFVGGAPDAPIKYNGAGNGAVLAGSPPNGKFGIQLNNYFFIGNTTANPSRIQWSILGNPEDWSGTGSGTQDVSTNDGDTLVGAAAIQNDRLILFKQHSIYELIVRNPPFPLFPKIIGTGAIGKLAIVVVDGIIYFITPEARMKAFDGYKILDFPDIADATWDGLSASRLQYIQGIYNQRLRQIWWICSNGSNSTNNFCMVWDLDRKAWLKHTSGFGMNVATLAQDRKIYAGAYDGKIYQMDVASTYTDASESAGTINSFWRTGWYDLDEMINNKYMTYVMLNFVAQTTGTFTFSYGFDFQQDRKSVSVNMTTMGSLWDQFLWDVGLWGGQTDQSKLVFTKGHGNFIQFFLQNNNNNEHFQFNGLEVPVKKGNPVVQKLG